MAYTEITNSVYTEIPGITSEILATNEPTAILIKEIGELLCKYTKTNDRNKTPSRNEGPDK